jgi:hypothetical protein
MNNPDTKPTPKKVHIPFTLPIPLHPPSTATTYIIFILHICMGPGQARLGEILLCEAEISPKRAGNFPYKCNYLAQLSGLSVIEYIVVNKIFLTDFDLKRSL